MLQVFPDLEQLSRAAAERIVAMGRGAIAAHGRFDWLLAGGRTPTRTYEILARDFRQGPEFWSRTHFFWGDERYVAPDHPESNYRLAKETLLDWLDVVPENVHRVPTELEDSAQAAAQYEGILPERPDLVLLGLGEDGHTASLFPGSPAIEETVRRVVPVVGPKPPPQRITITPPVLRAARHVLVLAVGADKAEAMRRTLAPQGDALQTPARLVRDALWLVSRAAVPQLDSA